MKEVVTPEDLVLYQKVSQRMAQAQEIQRFVYTHINEVYTLHQGDTFDVQTGVITRLKEPAPEPSAPPPEPESPAPPPEPESLQ